MGSVYVAGSVNLDLVAESARLPQPGETVLGRAFRRSPGGKGANQAVAAVKLGAEVVLVGKVGADPFGAELREYLRQQGVDAERVGIADAPTGVALIVVDERGENTIVVVPGANDALTPEDVAALPLTSEDVALSQLETPGPTIARFFERAKQVGATTVLNAAPARLDQAHVLDAADVLLVNETELSLFGGGHASVEPADAIVAAGGLRRRASQTVIVTLGGRGAVAVGEGPPLFVAGHPVSVVDTTGAGDAFAGALAASLSQGQPLRRALERANAAGALSVGRAGAALSSPTAAELRDFMAR